MLTLLAPKFCKAPFDSEAVICESPASTPKFPVNSFCFLGKGMCYIPVDKFMLCSLRKVERGRKMATETPRELLSNLLKRRDELRMESEALDSLIATYQKLMMLGKERESLQLDLSLGSSSRRAKSAYVAETLAEARRIIIAEGRPMSRSELVRRLEAEGYVIDGRDKSKVLGTNIWRSQRFLHVDGLGYWPKDVPMPR